jgi:hypothetical protein
LGDSRRYYHGSALPDAPILRLRAEAAAPGGAYVPALGNGTETGFNAIFDDMAGSNTQTKVCTSIPHQ